MLFYATQFPMVLKTALSWSAKIILFQPHHPISLMLWSTLLLDDPEAKVSRKYLDQKTELAVNPDGAGESGYL